MRDRASSRSILRVHLESLREEQADIGSEERAREGLDTMPVSRLGAVDGDLPKTVPGRAA